MPNTATHKTSHKATGKAHARTKAVAKARSKKNDASQVAAFATSLDATTKFFDGYFPTLNPGDFTAAQKNVQELDNAAEPILGNYAIGTVVQWAGQILAVAAQSLGGDGSSAPGGQVGPISDDELLMAMLGGNDDGSISDASNSDDDGADELSSILGL